MNARAAFLAVCCAALPAQAELAKRANELQPRIDAAIDRGVDWLLAQQLRDGSWGFHNGMFPTGMTALATFTLLKAGVPATHSSVRRALAFLEERRPEETYSAACNLLAFGATGDPSWAKKMQALLDDLLSWQQADGFSYPREWGNNVWGTKTPFRADLSNMQYAALGLRAATRAGLKVPFEAWAKLAQQTLAHQEAPSVVAVPQDKSRTSSPKQEAAGFHYALQNGEGARVTGSVTAAGVAILTLCKEALTGKISRDLDLRITRGIDLGLAWLTVNFSIGDNPKQPGGWYHYWLYGLERVCSLRGLETLAGHPWYLEGAQILVDRQKPTGEWPTGATEADTCFAILFLERATAPTTGGRGRKAAVGVWHSPRTGEDLYLQAQASNDGGALALWIEGLAAGALRDRSGAATAAVPGLRVLGVEYLVDDVVVATVKGDPTRGAKPGETFTAHWKPERRGKFTVTARMSVVEPTAARDAKEPVAVLTSKGFVVDAHFVHESWMDDAARSGVRNLMLPALRRGGITATASSRIDDGRGPAAAVDGHEATCWTCKPDDASPWLRIELDKAARADQLVLTQLSGREDGRGVFDRATRIRVTIQGLPQPLEVTLPEDPLAPALVPLPAAIAVRKLEIAILERVPGSRAKGECGFCEVALELAARAKR